MQSEKTNALVSAGSVITRLESACRSLAEAKSLDEAKLIRDQAEAIRHLMREQGFALEAINHAAELKLRAERKLGEFLKEMPKHNGDPRLHHATRLSDVGIEKTQSRRWQQIAGIPEPEFERHIAEAVEGRQELTTAGVLRLAKALTQPGRRECPTTEDGCTVEDLHSLVAGGKTFGTIYADPPWQYGNQGTRASTDKHYPTMPADEIAALPVEKLAAANAHLHLWTTIGFLQEAIDILRAWGFTYKSQFIWCKPQMGLGNYWRSSHEILLLGVRGHVPFHDHSLTSWGGFDRGRHSAKPEQVRLMIERASPGPRLELFGRQAVTGWTVWGNQITRDLFSPAKETA